MKGRKNHEQQSSFYGVVCNADWFLVMDLLVHMGVILNKDEALRLALEALKNNRRTHHYCEDTWYSCPKHEDGCANDSEGDECNCGANEANAGIDQAITAIKTALEAKDEPVAWCVTYNGELTGNIFENRRIADLCKRNLETKYGSEESREVVPIYTTPPQRKPLTDEELDNIAAQKLKWQVSDFARAIEAAHGIKGEA